MRDLGRSPRFHREVLGLAEIARLPFPFPSVRFRLGDRELHPVGGEGGAGPGAAAGAGGADPRRLHFAVRVRNYRGAALERLQGRGYREDAPAGGPARVLALPDSVVGHPQLYLLDPDGHLIEVNADGLDGWGAPAPPSIAAGHRITKAWRRPSKPSGCGIWPTCTG